MISLFMTYFAHIKLIYNSKKNFIRYLIYQNKKMNEKLEKVDRRISSDEEEEKDNLNTEQQNPTIRHKKQYSIKSWIMKTAYENQTVAKQNVEAEKIWTSNTIYNTYEGKKVVFRCNLVKKRGPQCAASMCLLYHHDSFKVTRYETNDEHTHETINLTLAEINKISSTAKTVESGTKRKRGRPAKLVTENNIVEKATRIGNFPSNQFQEDEATPVAIKQKVAERVCDKCKSKLIKKNGYFCPNKCKQM